MISGRNKKVDFTDNITINDAKNYKLISLEKDGASYQKTRNGKNLFDNSASPQFSFRATAVKIDNGIRVSMDKKTTYTYWCGVRYMLIDLTNYVGKTIRIKCDFIASGSNDGSYELARINGPTADTYIEIGNTKNSSEIISYKVTEITDNKKYLAVNFHANSISKSVTNEDYVDFTNIIVTVDDEDMTYEEYGISPTPDFPSEIKGLGAFNSETGKYDIEVNVSSGVNTSSATISLDKPLMGFKNGAKDKLVVDGGKVKVIRNIKEYAVNSEVSSVTIDDMLSGGSFMSSVGGTLSDKTITFDSAVSSANIIYEIAEPVTETVGAIEMPTIFEGTNTISIDVDLESNTSIKYVNEIVEIKSGLIKVYDSNEKLFNNNGIKTLHPLVAEITKKDNGDYYLELRDTLDNLEYYQKGMIIRCATPWGVQGFRCDNPDVNNNRIECKAWHLSYDSKNYIIKDAYSVDKNCNDALNHFNDATDITSPFTCISDITKILSTRMVTRTLFEIYENFISEDMYGGHWYRDNWTLGIKANIGQDRGVVLAQNKNITDMQISENWDDVCTKILPYTTDGETRIYLDNTYLAIEEKLYDIPYTKVVKFDNPFNKDDYEDYDVFLSETKEWLENTANAYLQENKVPKVNYSVSAKIDNVSDIGDIIYVKHPKCKVNITTNVIGITYDVNRDKYIKIEFGNFKKEIKNLHQQITGEIKKTTEDAIKENKVLLQKELDEATARINNTLGSSYVIYEGDKILVVDTLPKENAKYVIKISNGGIGFSSTGINGTFTSAWTIDGTLNMQNINVINLTASLIKGGTLKLGGVNNSSGTFELYDETGRLICLQDKTGLTCYALNGDYVKLNAEVGFAGFNKNNEKCYWADGDVFHMRNAEVENELKVASMIKFVPVNTSANRGIGIVAIPS